MKRWRSFLSLTVALLLSGASYTQSLPEQSVEQEGHLGAAKMRDPFMNRRIAAIEFRGNHAFSAEEIRAGFALMKVGKKYHPDKLEADLDRVRVLLYLNNGYLQMQAAKPEIEDSADGLRITIPVDEGPLYRAGKIAIEKAKVFSPDEVREIIALRSGEVVKAYSVVNRGLEALKKAYGDRGYLTFDAFFSPEFHPPSPGTNEAIVDVTYELEEGEPYRIGKISITADGPLDEKRFRSRLLIREGEIFNRTLFDLSLVEISEVLKNEGLSVSLVEDDVEFQTNEKTAQVNLNFDLRRESFKSSFVQRQIRESR